MASWESPFVSPLQPTASKTSTTQPRCLCPAHRDSGEFLTPTHLKVGDGTRGEGGHQQRLAPFAPDPAPPMATGNWAVAVAEPKLCGLQSLKLQLHLPTQPPIHGEGIWNPTSPSLPLPTPRCSACLRWRHVCHPMPSAEMPVTTVTPAAQGTSDPGGASSTTGTRTTAGRRQGGCKGPVLKCNEMLHRHGNQSLVL